MKKVLLFLMAMFAFGIQNVSAQDGIKIVTNHPDFKIKVKRCAASGKTVIIDLILNNEGTNDVENVSIHGGLYNCKTEAYDDEGNIYGAENVKVKVANAQVFTAEEYSFNIPVGVPMRASVCIEGVPQSAESIARLKVEFRCAAWGLDWNKPVKISNIPILRD